MKGEISKAIEIARKNKVVGHPLDAAVTVHPPEKLRPFLEEHAEDLRSLLIVSQVTFAATKDRLAEPFSSAEFEGLSVGVSRASGRKCNRCWIYSESVGADSKHPSVCERCLKNLE